MWSKITALPLWQLLLTVLVFFLCLQNGASTDKNWIVLLFWALLLFFQHSTQTQTSSNLLLPGPKQGKLYPAWWLRLLPCQPPEALAPFHGHVVPKPQCFSAGRSLLPGVSGCQQALSSRSCGLATAGRELKRGLSFLLACVMRFRQGPFPISYQLEMIWYWKKKSLAGGKTKIILAHNQFEKL